MVRQLIDENRTRLADSYGVGHVRWRSWEEGFYYPDPGVMAAFCRKWDVSMDWLYLGRIETLPESLKALMYLAYPDLLSQQVKRSGGAVQPACSMPAPGGTIPETPATGRRRRGKRATPVSSGD